MHNRRLRLIGLSLLILLGLFYANTETGAQVIKTPLGEYTWGYFGGSRESQGMSREDVIAREGSCPTGGCVLKLDQVEVRPSRARKGDILRADHHLYHPHSGAAGPPGVHQPGDFFSGEGPGEDQEYG